MFDETFSVSNSDFEYIGDDVVVRLILTRIVDGLPVSDRIYELRMRGYADKDFVDIRQLALAHMLQLMSGGAGGGDEAFAEYADQMRCCDLRLLSSRDRFGPG